MPRSVTKPLGKKKYPPPPKKIQKTPKNIKKKK